MALFVQVDEPVEEAGVPPLSIHHRVKSFRDVETVGLDGSKDIIREVELGCGETARVRGDRINEAVEEPGGLRHVADGCFDDQADHGQD